MQWDKLFNSSFIRVAVAGKQHVMTNNKEYLEELMDLKKTCTIKFNSIDGGISTIKAHIIDMENISGREIIETDAGLHIGMDQLIEVNGRVFQNYC